MKKTGGVVAIACLALLLGLHASVIGAAQPERRLWKWIHYLPRFAPAFCFTTPRYSTGGEVVPPSNSLAPISLAASGQEGNLVTIEGTRHDRQHIDSMDRQVTHHVGCTGIPYRTYIHFA